MIFSYFWCLRIQFFAVCIWPFNGYWLYRVWTWARQQGTIVLFSAFLFWCFMFNFLFITVLIFLFQHSTYSSHLTWVPIFAFAPSIWVIHTLVFCFKDAFFLLPLFLFTNQKKKEKKRVIFFKIHMSTTATSTTSEKKKKKLMKILHKVICCYANIIL